MKRRSFLAMLGLAPAAAVAAAKAAEAAPTIPASGDGMMEFKDGFLRLKGASAPAPKTGTITWYDDGDLVIASEQFRVRQSPLQRQFAKR